MPGCWRSQHRAGAPAGDRQSPVASCGGASRQSRSAGVVFADSVAPSDHRQRTHNINYLDSGSDGWRENERSLMGASRGIGKAHSDHPGVAGLRRGDHRLNRIGGRRARTFEHGEEIRHQPLAWQPQQHSGRDARGGRRRHGAAGGSRSAGRARRRRRPPCWMRKDGVDRLRKIPSLHGPGLHGDCPVTSPVEVLNLHVEGFAPYILSRCFCPR